MKLNAAFILFLLFSLFSNQTEAAEKKNTGLCASTELNIFSCSTKNGKLISVCSELTTSKVAKIEYRFGKMNKVELTLPKSSEDQVSYNSVMYSGGGGAYVRFNHGDIDYIVFSKMVKGEGASSGVLIHNKGKKSVSVRCKIEGDVDLDKLEKLQLKKEANDVDPLIDD
jgi:hypothetical protein